MIFYDAENNHCRQTAFKLKEYFNQEIIDIRECLNNQKFQFYEENHLGFIIPVEKVTFSNDIELFFKNLNIQINSYPYTYLIVCYNHTTGSIGKDVNTYMKEKNLALWAMYGLKDEHITDILTNIKAKRIGNYLKDSLPSILSIALKAYLKHRK